MKRRKQTNDKTKGLLHMILLVVVIAVLSLVSVVGVGKTKKGSVEGIRLGLDLAGGVSITYETVKENPSQTEMDDTRYKLQRRVESYSTEAKVYQEGNRRINVDIPGVDDANEILEELGKAGSLQFKTEDGNVVIEGSDVESAEEKYTKNEMGQTETVVVLTLKPEGSSKFAKATGENIGKPISIYYDGKLIEAPIVQTEITGGVATISTKTIEEARNLATYIRIGALPLELTEANSKVVGAELGSKAIQTSLIAGAIGLFLVILFMIITYRMPGVAASIALCIYVGLILVFLSLTGATLTLFGIAGIVLSIGMAVDANVIIFTRIREELAAGKTVRSAMQVGYHKALSAIIDGNVTTLIAAVVIYVKGSGTVRGFAETLALGIVLSMITALFVTKFALQALYNLGVDDAKYFGIQKERKTINFTKHIKKYFVISGALIALGVVFLFVNKQQIGKTLNFGLDFVGGTSTQVTFADDVEMTDDSLRAFIQDTLGISSTSSKIQGENTFVVKTKSLDLEQRTKLTQAFVDQYKVQESEVQIENTSATFSSQMRKDAVTAVIIATICMLIYIWIRFKDIKFGASAVSALVHDVLITFMVYAVCRIEVDSSFIACMLTIVGYSINATIVIFDRMRENMKNRLRSETIEDVVNKSITQTISRSINTSLTTFIMVFVLFILGVDTMRSFAGPLMVGIVCGAYSSICITGTLWYLFARKSDKKTK